MPLLLWPFPSGIAPPPFRPQTGKIVVIDTVSYTPSREFEPPQLGESCALVFYVGNGLPTTQQPVLFTFIRPDGTFHRGDPTFSWIGTPGTAYFYPFPSGTYLVYIFDVGELNQVGTWQVSAITTNYFSDTFNFAVVPVAIPVIH